MAELTLDFSLLEPETASENHKTTRVTRSSTRQTTQLTTKPVAQPAPKTKKAKLSSKEKPESKSKTTEAPPPPPSEGGNGSKTVVIEHCTQCKQFKIRAVKVKNDLESAVSDINVLVNPEKPRRGCFEVREEGGKKFISLLDMKRPFAPMKALDMDAVISDIIDQIK
ncbi:hypothetical protein L1987_72229 [Smallanthus sonchifolius]|uniref:Uncharacterized protein n=1 Tax=Smallanthus sonchifolius TaxID=185202 RepID=A0ACB9AUN1_9ASTR|nr:hypothetical protein L1987_72229 [Smallanthus sonchifolius]